MIIHKQILAAVLFVTAVAPAFAKDVTFNYQGRVKVQGQPFTGSGQFKFAIVNTSGTATLWSNDGTISGEPGTHVSIPVADGVFSVEVGGSGMSSISSLIFTSDSPLRLRTWFSDGVNPFEQLNPDHKLIDITLNTVESGKQDFTIYVNSTSGNDANNGLTPQTAKKSIQGGIDILPDRLNSNVTIDVAPGVYRESITISGIYASAGKELKILGDDTWSGSASLTSTPDVRVTGRDSDGASDPVVRPVLFTAQQCANVVLEGLHFEYGAQSLNGAVQLEDGRYKVKRCLISNSHWGLNTVQAVGEFTDCRATSNTASGLCVTVQSRIVMTNCVSTHNDLGVYVAEMSVAQFWGNCVFSNNRVGGNFIAMSNVTAWPTGQTKIQNNTQYGCTIGWHATYAPSGTSTQMSGNPQNYLLHNSGSLY